MVDDEPNIRKRFRSPPYPYLSLSKAIDRVAQLHRKAQHFAVGLPVLADAWDLSPQSGGLLKSAAALIQFGLLSDQGSGDGRKFQLTDTARRIVGDADPRSEKRAQLIKEAALLPSIHRELWEKFGFPAHLSDALLKNYLVFDRQESGESAYSSQAADEVILNYRDAIVFSGLQENSPSRPDEEAESDVSNPEFEMTSREMPAQASVQAGSWSNGSPSTEWLKASLSGETVVRLIVEGPMGSKEIGKLIKLLEVHRLILDEE
ncbi:hypothetical protein [Rhizobium sp. SL42]|uniref:hypothetical protein n=1 Tax=Rhizobium sp. SL42 TaxID=2806346 RepID=UPI001F378DDD|nr:hypothetical protein [Rhizobium sp. SL42]UJW75693.1 hypothetical protein IM739_04110 [Rhizobium sp. SL42]